MDLLNVVFGVSAIQHRTCHPQPILFNALLGETGQRFILEPPRAILMNRVTENDVCSIKLHNVPSPNGVGVVELGVNGRNPDMFQ